jgi:hypothetical protein
VYLVPLPARRRRHVLDRARALLRRRSRASLSLREGRAAAEAAADQQREEKPPSKFRRHR